MIMLELRKTTTKNKVPTMNLTADDQRCKIEDQEINNRSVVNILLKYTRKRVGNTKQRIRNMGCDKGCTIVLGLPEHRENRAKAILEIMTENYLKQIEDLKSSTNSKQNKYKKSHT